MNKKDKVKNLIKIADELDRMGEFDLASEIDDFIREESMDEFDVEIPEEEYDLIKDIYDSLGQSIK